MNKLEISGIIREKLSPEIANEVMKWIDDLEFTANKYSESEPVLHRLELQIDDTEGMLKLYKNRLEADEDPMIRMILLEKVARFGTRMFMLKRIQSGKTEHS